MATYYDIIIPLSSPFTCKIGLLRKTNKETDVIFVSIKTKLAFIGSVQRHVRVLKIILDK